MAFRDYRLPLNIIEREIENIKKTGVNIILNTKIGVDVSFRSLQKNYDAIFIAIGAQKTLQLGIPGEDLEGVYHGLDFLKRVILQRTWTSRERRLQSSAAATPPSTPPEQRFAWGQRSGDALSSDREDMPADKVEIKDALEEGVKIRTLVNPTDFVGIGGKLNSICIMKQKLGQFDSSVAVKRSPAERPYVEEFDIAIPAISQTPDTKFIKGTIQLNGDRAWRTAIPRQPQCPVFLSAETPTAVPRILSMRSTRQKWRPPELTSIWAGQVSLAKGFDQEITGLSH